MGFWHTLDTPQKRVKEGHSQAGAQKACAGYIVYLFQKDERNVRTEVLFLLSLYTEEQSARHDRSAYVRRWRQESQRKEEMLMCQNKYSINTIKMDK